VSRLLNQFQKISLRKWLIALIVLAGRSRANIVTIVELHILEYATMCAYSQINKRVTAVFLLGYGDDSTDETQQRVFALSSVVAPEPVWESLEKMWELRTGGIPFHATDCDGDKGDYANCTHKENKELYKDLCLILANSGAKGFSCVVDLAGHREFFPDVPHEMSYHFCMVRVINYWVHRAAEWGSTGIKFSFDNRVTSNFNAAYVYSLMVNDETQPHRLLMSDELSFLCSRKNPRIQVGDLYPRECMKYLDNDIGPVKRPERKSFAALRATGNFGADFYHRDYFKDKFERSAELEKLAGFNQRDYENWLREQNIADNVSNRFRFLTFIDLKLTHQDFEGGGTKLHIE
jgi:hypothetical protein